MRLLTSAQISSYVVAFSNSHVRSTTDTSMVGTRKAIPVSLPATSGTTLATALAAPVEEGMMLPDAARPPRQSFFDAPSTVGCDAVMAWMVVIKPRLMPNASLTAFTKGARPLVVHEAQETQFISVLYVSWFTPITMTWLSSLAGAENTTFFAPALRGISAGSRVCDSATFLPSITKESPSTSTVPSYLPWMESYFIWYARYSAS